ncbi:MAG: hypothetical protein IJR44_01925 [Neisseriaceae bacterium]|nr:hypothetical protein [Neisseriaceae bacterium]
MYTWVDEIYFNEPSKDGLFVGKANAGDLYEWFMEHVKNPKLIEKIESSYFNYGLDFWSLNDEEFEYMSQQLLIACDEIKGLTRFKPAILECIQKIKAKNKTQ